MLNLGFLLLLLLSLSRDEVQACNSQSNRPCKDVRFICPTGETYAMTRYRRDGDCIPSTSTENIINHCWKNDKTQARKCMKYANKCSSPFGSLSVEWTNDFFETACQTHDMCYYTKGRGKSFCDDQMWHNMLDTCSGIHGAKWYGFGFITCDAAASLIWFGLTTYGYFKDYYSNGQDNGCWRKGQTKMDEFYLSGVKSPSDGRANTTFGIELDLAQSYNEIQGNCWADFGSSASNLWNDTQPLVENCKSQMSKDNSVQCWKKIRKVTKVELKKKKNFLIECVDIKLKTNNMESETKGDTMVIEKAKLWITAQNNKTALLTLEKEAVSGIENSWKQSQVYWNNCWKESIKLARKEGIEEANKKIDSCWRMKIDKKIKEDLDITE